MQPLENCIFLIVFIFLVGCGFFWPLFSLYHCRGDSRLRAGRGGTCGHTGRAQRAPTPPEPCSQHLPSRHPSSLPQELPKERVGSALASMGVPRGHPDPSAQAPTVTPTLNLPGALVPRNIFFMQEMRKKPTTTQFPLLLPRELFPHRGGAEGHPGHRQHPADFATRATLLRGGARSLPGQQWGVEFWGAKAGNRPRVLFSSRWRPCFASTAPQAPSPHPSPHPSPMLGKSGLGGGWYGGRPATEPGRRGIGGFGEM